MLRRLALRSPPATCALTGHVVRGRLRSALAAIGGLRRRSLTSAGSRRRRRPATDDRRHDLDGACPAPASRWSTIGDKNSTEQFVLGELYCQALPAQGFKVTLNRNIGPTEVTHPGADRAGGWRCTRSTCRPGTPRSPATGAVSRRRTGLPGRPALRARARARAARPDPVQRHRRDRGDGRLRPRSTGSRSIARPAQGGDDGDARGPPQFQQSPTACRQLEQAYGFAPAAFKPLDIGAQYQALDHGHRPGRRRQHDRRGARRAATTGCSTTPATCSAGATSCRSSSAKVLDVEGPAFAATINKVSALLTLQRDAPAQRGRSRSPTRIPSTVAQQVPDGARADPQPEPAPAEASRS